MGPIQLVIITVLPSQTWLDRLRLISSDHNKPIIILILKCKVSPVIE